MVVTGKPTETFTTSSTGWTRVLPLVDYHPRQRKPLQMYLLGRSWIWLHLILLGVGSGGSVRDDGEGDHR